MATDYRRLRSGEAPALIGLWREVLDNGDEQSRLALRDFGNDERWAERTFVAVDDGALIASAKYWLREIRDARGQPQRVGHVLGVATREDARRHGHASRLLNMAIDAMRAEGCAWSILFARDEAMPLYERLGWRAFASPWQQGPVALSHAEASHHVERVDARHLTERLNDLCAVYAAFNAHRPLTVVRDDAYWRGYGAWMLTDWLTHHGTRIAVARGDVGVVGYAVYNTYPPHFVVTEVCVLPDHADAAAALLDEIARETPDVAGARLLLPRDPITNPAVTKLFGGHGQHGAEHTGLMAKALTTDDAELIETFAMPDARYGSLDGY